MSLPPLKSVHVDLLMVIWEDYWLDPNPVKGFLRNQLVTRLQEKYRESGRSDADIPAAITLSQHCSFLRELPKLIITQGAETGGRDEDRYSFNKPQGAGWPTTAVMLIAASGKDDFTKEELVQIIEPLRLRNRKGSELFDRDAILKRIEWALGRDGNNADYLHEVHGSAASLGVTERVTQELPYLIRVAEHCHADEESLFKEWSKQLKKSIEKKNIKGKPKQVGL